MFWVMHCTCSAEVKPLGKPVAHPIIMAPGQDTALPHLLYGALGHAESTTASPASYNIHECVFKYKFVYQQVLHDIFCGGIGLDVCLVLAQAVLGFPRVHFIVCLGVGLSWHLVGIITITVSSWYLIGVAAKCCLCNDQG